jgi:hypothetical protein
MSNDAIQDLITDYQAVAAGGAPSHYTPIRAQEQHSATLATVAELRSALEGRAREVEELVHTNRCLRVELKEQTAKASLVPGLTATLDEARDQVNTLKNGPSAAWIAEYQRDGTRYARLAAQILIEEIGAPGPENVIETATRARDIIRTLRGLDEAPHVCPGCHAVGPERCAPGCIDAEIEAEHREAIESGNYDNGSDHDE